MKGIIFYDEYIIVTKGYKNILLTLGIWTQDYVDYLERNKMIDYV